MHNSPLFGQVKERLLSTVSFLEDKPEENADSSARACWLAAAGMPMSAVKAMETSLPTLSENQIIILHQLIDQRLKNTPLAHITGRQNFMGIEMLSDGRALIPRRETEILGRKALEICKKIVDQKKTARVLDVCCGGGNLGLAIAHYNPATIVFATDLSREAVELTRDNISFLNLGNRMTVESGDLFSAFENESFYESADLVVCNPPYISTAKVGKMNQEILEHEPALAFDGGMFGTKIIQNVISQAPKFLTNSGWLLLEVGVGQGEFIMNLCERSNSFSAIESCSDKMGNIRVIAAQKT